MGCCADYKLGTSNFWNCYWYTVYTWCYDNSVDPCVDPLTVACPSKRLRALSRNLGSSAATPLYSSSITTSTYTQKGLEVAAMDYDELDYELYGFIADTAIASGQTYYRFGYFILDTSQSQWNSYFFKASTD